MSTHRTPSRDTQLALALTFGDPADQLGARAETLVALHTALRFLLDVADGHTEPTPATAERLQRSLDVLATFNLDGRLGRVVRHFRTEPPTGASWEELVDEFAFLISLYHGQPAP